MRTVERQACTPLGALVPLRPRRCTAPAHWQQARPRRCTAAAVLLRAADANSTHTQGGSLTWCSLARLGHGEVGQADGERGGDDCVACGAHLPLQLGRKERHLGGAEEGGGRARAGHEGQHAYMDLRASQGFEGACMGNVHAASRVGPPNHDRCPRTTSYTLQPHLATAQDHNTPSKLLLTSPRHAYAAPRPCRLCLPVIPLFPSLCMTCTGPWRLCSAVHGQASPEAVVDDGRDIATSGRRMLLQYVPGRPQPVPFRCSLKTAASHGHGSFAAAYRLELPCTRWLEAWPNKDESNQGDEPEDEHIDTARTTQGALRTVRGRCAVTTLQLQTRRPLTHGSSCSECQTRKARLGSRRAALGCHQLCLPVDVSV